MTETSDLRVRPATSGERRGVVDLLATTFGDDPVFRHLLPRSARRRDERLRRAFALEVARSWRRGGMWTAGDTAGAIVCFPPGRWESTRWENIRQAPAWRYVFGRRLDTAAAVIACMEAEQRTLPDHWFLCYAAVESSQQGNGIGRRLAEPVLAECDRTGTPAYLEATNEGSRNLAARYGFVDRPPLALPHGGPTVFPMWREPA